MSILPFQPSDVVIWFDEAATVVLVRGDRIAIETSDSQVHITTEAALRVMLSSYIPPRVKGGAA
jgi:hypothetical protein